MKSDRIVTFGLYALTAWSISTLFIFLRIALGKYVDFPMLEAIFSLLASSNVFLVSFVAVNYGGLFFGTIAMLYGVVTQFNVRSIMLASLAAICCAAYYQTVRQMMSVVLT